MDCPLSCDPQGANTTILLVVGTGGYSHAAPVLELGRILWQRGHRIFFATHQGQQKWFEKAHFLQMQKSDIRKDYRDYFSPKIRVDAFWASDYAFLMDIVKICEPDMIVADFFDDPAVRDIQHQLGIPVATVWPQMPYAMVGASYIPGIPGFQVDALTSEHASMWRRVRAACRPLRAMPAILSYLWFVKNMRRKSGKPNHLVLVNSFWGLETAKDLPPLIAAIDPILSEDYDPLDSTLEAFYASHHRVVYVSFGTHVFVQSKDLDKLVGAFSTLLKEGLLDWSSNDRQRSLFSHNRSFGDKTTIMSSILNNQHPAWLFTLFAPQRAVLARSETVLFVTHGGGSSVQEAAFHETPMLQVLGFFFDQPLNALRVREAGTVLSLNKADFSESEALEKARALLLDRGGVVAQDVRRMGHIARVCLRKKEFGADIIEELLYDRLFSLPVGTLLFEDAPVTRPVGQQVHGQRGRPMHLQTADARLSAWHANNWDLTCVFILGSAAAG
ncbi:hypothetical protein BX600DRAFT_489728 [Xylariales sp. PMI_506]|nr:hypothetical protein BX600DRAFT_489728 [Xylariales sp. PMI_506]